MKGIIFSQLFDLIETAHGYELVDKIISKCNLTNDGAYTSVGTYDFSELAQIAVQLSQELNTDLPTLLKLFGGHLFGQFTTRYTEMCNYSDAFSMLRNVEQIIHVEVRKLYPEAELPSFTYAEPSEDCLEMTYKSKRPLADLAEGLIGACVDHFGETIEIEREDLASDGDFGAIPVEKTVINVAQEQKMNNDVLMRRLERERKSRIEAEEILEVKTREVYIVNESLRKLTTDLKIQHQRIAAIVENASDGIITIKPNGSVSSLNPAAAQIFGYASSSSGDTQFANLFAEDQRDDLLAFLAGTDEKSSEEFHVMRPDGVVRKVELTIGRVDSEDHISTIVVVRDRTDVKVLEARSAHVQKMESVGKLAAGIAHEINTPIQYVGDNVKFVQEAFQDLDGLLDQVVGLADACSGYPDLSPKSEAIQKACVDIDLDFLKEEVPVAIEQTLVGTERVSQIVRAMKEFSHPGNTTMVSVDINKAIGSTLMVSKNEWKYVAETVLDLEADLPSVMGIPGSLNQVFLNLIVNAAHAIEKNKVGKQQFEGEIKIKTRSELDYLEIIVSDNGCGIPESAQTKIFDPFFTTKPVGKGSGQGLSIVHDVIVDKHSGEVILETKEGVGTTFTIRLPRDSSSRRQLVGSESEGGSL